MPERSPFIQHIFSGGWATSFGPAAVGLGISGNGIMQIPFLIDAENIWFESTGGFRKIPGTTRRNSANLESGAAITGLYDFWQGPGGGSTQQHLVCHVGTKVYADDGDGTFAEKKSGLTSGAIPSYATFDDLLIISSDSSDVPSSWDGSTYQNLAGSPPNFSFSVKHKNFMFAAGIPATPSRLHYSDSLDPENWTTGNSGTIDIDPNDGDQITGLISHKNELWIFKGPYKGSIHRITGNSNSTWARTTFIEGVGAVWHNGIFRYRDDVAFIWSDGSIRTLSATASFGDFQEAALSFPIQPWLDDHLNFTRLKNAWATLGPGGRRVFLSVSIDSSTTNNTVLVLDTGFEIPRWSNCPAIGAGAVISGQISQKPTLLIAGNDGWIRRWDSSTKSIDAITAIASKVTTPHLDYGEPHKLKTITGASLAIQPRNAGDITFGWQRDTFNRQTDTINQGGNSDVLGDADINEFTLDVSTLAGTFFVHKFRTLENAGAFRSLSYQITHSIVNEDVEVHSFGSFLTDDGVSRENL